MKKLKTTLCLHTLLLLASGTYAQSEITVIPSPEVEVGEAVYFDATHYTNIYGYAVHCEWDFGNGHYLKAGEPNPTDFNTGIAVLHHFMTPGTYNVKLFVSTFDMSKSPPERVELLARDSITIAVTGEAPLAGFELWHAPIHARTAQYLLGIPPEGYTPSQIYARVENSTGSFSEILQGFTIDGKQRFLLRNATLPAGDYIVIAELKDGNSIVSTIREKFSKPYDGPPHIGIDENNGFIIDGVTPFIPISPYMLNSSRLELWSRLTNTMHTVGWYNEHNSTTWADFNQQTASFNLYTVGPSRGTGMIGRGNTEFKQYIRNTDPDHIANYVEETKHLENILGWNWFDEPNMGGRYLRLPGYVIAAWTHRVNRLDPQRPSGQQYYGFDYLPFYNPREGTHDYSFMRSASLFGGKKAFTGNFITHDTYAINYQNHSSYLKINTREDSPLQTRGVIDLWLEGLDNFVWNAADLIPLGTFIETQNISSCNRMQTYEGWTAGPTPGDVRTQAWGSIVHGMKYIGYFQHFAPTPASNMSALGELKEAITDLAPIILSAPSSHNVSHNANEAGKRVDVMVRETSEAIYIFAVRVTEPKSMINRVPEPETIDFEMNTGLSASTAYDEMEKYRWNYITLNASEGQTEFDFTVPEGSILPGTLIVSSVKDGTTPECPEWLYDNITGNAYPGALDRENNLIYGIDDEEGGVFSFHPTAQYRFSGDVNYSTGRVVLTYDNPVAEGKDFIQVAYAAQNREAREIPLVNGKITEPLEKNAVRIYRIPLASETTNVDTRDHSYLLNQNYPNPFSQSTTISYHIPTSSNVSIKVFDILGREVRTLVSGVQPAGSHTVQWDGTNSAGQTLGNGIYFYQLRNGHRVTNTKKMILNR